MSNIARQYIHESYIDVFNVFFIVTTFTLNILYSLLYWRTTPTSHRAHSASGRIQSRDTRQLPFPLPFQQRVRFVCTQISLQSKVRLEIRQVRHLVSFSPSKSDQAHGASHWGRRGAAGAPSTLQPGDWGGTTERNERGGGRTNTAQSHSRLPNKWTNSRGGASVDGWRPCVFTYTSSTTGTLIEAA